MGTTLTGTFISQTYDSLIKVTDNDNLTSTAKRLTDGLGNDSPLFLSTTKLGVGVTPTTTFQVAGNSQLGGNLTVTGNLIVQGTTTTVDTDTLSVKDPLIIVGSDNTSSDAVDLGFYGVYDTSGSLDLYAGLFRDASDAKFHLFKDLQTEPTTTVNKSGTGYTKAGLVIGGLEATTGSFSGNIEATSYIQSNNNFLTKGTLKFSNNADNSFINGFRRVSGADTLELLNISNINNSEGSGVTFGGTITVSGGDITLGGTGRIQGIDTVSASTDAANKAYVDAQITAQDLDIAGDSGTGSVDLDSQTFTVAGGTNVTTSVSGQTVTINATGSIDGSGTANDVVMWQDSDTLTDAPIAISGNNATFAGNVDLGDSKLLNIGAGSDLNLSHDGTHSYIQNNTGTLHLMQNTDDGDMLFMCDDGSGGTTEYLRLDGGDVETVFTKRAKFIDNTNLNIGSSRDLQIFHDGTNSFIKNNTGGLFIDQELDDGDISFRSDNGSGGKLTYLFLDGSNTRLQFNTNLITGDNNKLVFGNSGDLEIYHDGANSFVQDTGTGGLFLEGNGEVRIRKSATSEIMAKFIADGAVELYHDNSKKLETTSTGISVTGTADISSQVLVGGNDSIFAENNLRFLSSGEAFIDHGTVGQAISFRVSNSSGLDTVALTLNSSGSSTFGGNITTSGHIFIPVAKNLYFGGGSHTYIGEDIDDRLRFFVGGAEFMRFTEDTSDTIQLFQDTTVTGELNVQDATHSTFRVKSGNNDNILFAQAIQSDNARVGTQTNTPLSFFTNSSERVRVTTSGLVGINYTLPSAKLHIETGSDEGIRIHRTGTNANFGAIEFRNSDDSATNSRIGYNANEMRLEATNQFRFVTNSSDTMFINSSGNVGIGTTSPATGSRLTLRTSASTGMTILSASNTGECFINFADNDDPNRGSIFYGHQEDKMVFSTNDVAALTINSSQNATFVGKVSVDAGSTFDSMLTIQGNESGGQTQTFLHLNSGNNSSAFPFLATLNNADISSATFGWGFVNSNTNGNLELYRWNNAAGVLNLSFERSSGNATFVGDVNIGVADGGERKLKIHGGASGSPEGGQIELHTAADHDSTYAFYRIDAYQDDFRIGRAGTTDILLDSSGNTTFSGFVKAPFFTSDGGRGFKQDSVAFVSTYSNGADANAVNDIGSTSNKWRDAYFSGQVNSATISTTGNATFAGQFVNITHSTNAGAGMGLNITNTNTSGNSFATINIAGANGTVNTQIFSDGSGTGGFGSAGSVIRTSTNHPIYIGTNSTTALTLDTSQNATFAGAVTVGTGTVAAANAAADDFVIKGPGTTATGMTISNTSDSGTGTIFFGDTTSSSAAGFRYNHNTGDMAISAEDNVTFDCDNVGIGTTSPGTKLDVAGSGKFQPGIADGDALVTIAQTNSNAYVHAGLKINAGNTNPFYIYQSGSSNTLRFNYNSLSDAGGQMVITDGGNVGIGAASPSYKLQVGGTAYINDTLYVNGATTIDADLTISEANGEINFTSGNGNIQTTTGSTSLVLGVNSSEKFRIHSSGNIGIGETSPAEALTVVGTIRMQSASGDTDGLHISSDSNGDALINAGYSVSDLKFATADLPRMTIDSSGRVGIGTTTPQKTLHIEGETGASASQLLVTGASDTTGHTAGILLRAEGGEGDSSLRAKGGIFFEREAANGLGKLHLCNNNSNNNDSAGLSDAALTIAQNKNIGIGTTSPSTLLHVGLNHTVGSNFASAFSSSNFFVNNGANGGAAVFQQGTASANLAMFGKDSSNTAISFFNSDLATNTSAVGSITTNSSATAFNTSSDYRLKEDLKDFTGLDLVNQIPVYDFKWKLDDTRAYGVLAHELQNVLPQAVYGEKDANEMQGVDYSKIVPLLIKSIQELQKEIEILKNK